jgi:two-component system chemotaxis response regulator CheB
VTGSPPRNGTAPVRVLIADDSATMRELLSLILAEDPGIEVVATARDGEQALELTRYVRPDVITMDITMPRMDGIEATRRIMTECPTPIVIVSGLDVASVDVSFKALHAGALTLVSKPAGAGSPQFEESAWLLRTTVKAMAGVMVVRRLEHAYKNLAGPVELDPHRATSVVAIAASAGGPSTLCQLFAYLPARFGVPILLVQHIARGFSDGLVATLQGSTALRVSLARAGEVAVPGHIYVAPDDRHLVIDSQFHLGLSDDPPEAGLRPSANPMFRAVAQAFGSEAVAVVLTGMGQDGVEGLRDVRRLGGLVIGQSRESALVFGMPAAAQEAGLTHAMWNLEDIGVFLKTLGGGSETGSSA